MRERRTRTLGNAQGRSRRRLRLTRSVSVAGRPRLWGGQSSCWDFLSWNGRRASCNHRLGEQDVFLRIGCCVGPAAELYWGTPERPLFGDERLQQIQCWTGHSESDNTRRHLSSRTEPSLSAWPMDPFHLVQIMTNRLISGHRAERPSPTCQKAPEVCSLPLPAAHPSA